jgi:YgiT-type zinc finger domain-containing protein
MQCVICKHGELHTGTTTVTLERDNVTLVFKDVPARVCENCGEAYVDAMVTRQLLNEADDAVNAGVEVDIRHFKAA